MQELAEIRFNDDRIVLKDHLVKTAILPMVSRELERDVHIQGNCILEGAVYARNLAIQQGNVRIQGAVFAQVELHVNSDSKDPIFFEKAVASAQAVVSHAPSSRLHFLSDVSAKRVHLRNAYVAASIYADEIVLEDCVVIGGVFATRTLELHNCIVGTFNSPSVRASKQVYLLLPSAFSVESISCLPDTHFYNLTLADLGALMRGIPEAPLTGRIHMDVGKDEVRTVLVDEATQQVMRSYSVVGKVLAADLLDIDKLQNHFLLSCAGLGSQLARTYDLGLGADGNAVKLTPEAIATFFFDVLWGIVQVSELDGRFDLNMIISRFAKDTGSNDIQAPNTLDLSNVEVPLAGEATEPPSIPGTPTGSTSAFCIHCGGEVTPGSTFCEHCGKSLE
jgi:hypothetical protein